MLYTSYFAKQKYNTSSNLYAITAKKPSFFKGEHLSIVAPDAELVRDYKQGLVSTEYYTVRYINMLNDHEVDIIQCIKRLPEESILLCYEGPDKFCHRHILAAWLKARGIAIEEFDSEASAIAENNVGRKVHTYKDIK